MDENWRNISACTREKLGLLSVKEKRESKRKKEKRFLGAPRPNPPIFHQEHHQRVDREERNASIPLSFNDSDLPNKASGYLALISAYIIHVSVELMIYTWYDEIWVEIELLIKLLGRKLNVDELPYVEAMNLGWYMKKNEFNFGFWVDKIMDDVKLGLLIFD